MPAFRIIDVDGIWVMNPHAFMFVDPETQVRYEPAGVAKVSCKPGSWLALQMAAKVIVEAPDPMGSVEKPAAKPQGRAVSKPA